jgi:hypothetical protein
MVNIAPGSLIIDMGQTTQTVANALKPYGLVYDMVTNFKTPADRAINTHNLVIGADFTAEDLTPEVYS